MATLLKKSDNFRLNVNLQDLHFNRDCFKSFDIESVDRETFFNFVFCSPVESIDASHYGVKFSEIKAINKSNHDVFFNEVLKEMNIESVNLFKVFDSEPDKNGKVKERCNLKENLIKDDTSFLYLYTGGARCEISLFLSIRNALAHGNIFRYDGYYYLYSVSNKNAMTVDEFERKITFLMKIIDISLLKKGWDVLLKYMIIRED